MNKPTIESLKKAEINEVASFISAGYFNDIFFKWVVPDDEVRHFIVTEYYKVYLNAVGAMVHVAKNDDGKIVGTTVWLPHDVDSSIYDDIDAATGKYAKNFRAVADASHDSEPTDTPFYQLVGIVVDPQTQGQGIGYQLLKAQLDHLDKIGIPTYLEASTPYVQDKGVYGKFGYKPYKELIYFDENKAVLYPLFREVKT